ncbi:MAG: PTS glucose transporter subunit IIA [Mycoplasmataceae bacterium]|jgi:glucose-specific phosphotransferase system IIA component|nr:PTS glucose transporter subunit IIA [Mycoplasmataceae bacterium]
MGFFSKLFGKKNKQETVVDVLNVCAPVDGEVVSTEKVKDETFSQNMIGRGFAIIPSSGEFVAPIDGELTLVAETGHAFSIKSNSGVEILIHIGIDTVNINSKRKPEEPIKGFEIHVKTGDRVKTGTPVITADLSFIKSNKLDTITPVIIINNEFSTNKIISDILVTGNVTKGTKIIEVK